MSIMQACVNPACGHLNRPSARFCEKCGQGLERGRWAPLRRGQVLRGGIYRILEPLGRGGMGALYLAADTCAFDRKCVVKELLDYYDPTDEEEARQAEARFETEGRLLAELSHPGIPRIYSYFSDAGRYYIVMEYIEGETLERAVTHRDPLGRTLPARPLAAEEVVRHAIRVCRVLEYLAGRQTPVVHHDVKPANLIVDGTSGEVRLVDFGTARTRTRWATQARLEQGMVAFGTVGYAAPEQHQGDSEPRSDIYGLAATVYHLLTDDDPGEHPFHFPRLDRLPGPLATALSRALHLEVRRRSTAAELRQALEAWIIPEDGAQPFVFRNGTAAQTTSDLVVLCDLYWDEARQHLAGGDFERWFRTRNRHDLVAKSQSARLEADPDAALEAFLHRLDPRLPPPRLGVDPAGIEFRQVAGRGASQQLVVSNRGRGYARATFQPSAPWLSVEPSSVGCLAGNEMSVTVCVDAAALRLRREHHAVITCAPGRGAHVSVPVALEMNLWRELPRRWSRRLGAAAGSLGTASSAAWRGARRGLEIWRRSLASLLRSRLAGVLLAFEILALALAMVAMWSAWTGTTPGLEVLAARFLKLLPLALLAAGLLPALLLILACAAWEMAKRVQKRVGR
jgi:serine/threonine protein kinase